MCLIPLLSFGQKTFEKTFNYSSDVAGTSVLQIASGEYIVCGYELDDVNDDYDVFVAKFNSSGEQVWKQIYTGIGIGDDWAEYITTASYGDYLITGTTEDVVNDQYDAFIMRIQSDGTLVWQVTEGVPADDDYANYIAELSDGTIAICGASSDGVTLDAWLCIVDEFGDFVDEEFYGLSGLDEAFSFIETSTGEFIICGNSYDDVNEDYDGIIIKALSDLTEDWMYYTNTTLDEFYTDIVLMDNGDIVIVGSEEDDVNGDMDLLLERVNDDASSVIYSYTFDYEAEDDWANRIYVDGTDFYIAGGVTNSGGLESDAFLAKVNVSNGTFIWAETYGDDRDDEFLDFDFTSDNGFICVGYSDYSAMRTDLYLVKTDEFGQQIELASLTTTAASAILSTTATTGGNITDDGNGDVTARGVCYSTTSNPTTANSKTTDGSGIGSFVSNISGLTPNTIYYVRAYAENSAGTAYGNEITFTTGTSGLSNSEFTEIAVYPNPASDYILVSGIKISSDNIAEIYNETGQLIKSIALNDNKIDISSLSEGIYILHLSINESNHLLRFVKR